MPRPRTNFQKPKDAKKTLGRIFGYMLHRKWMLLLVLFTVAVSSGAGVVGNYLLKPVINGFILPGDRVGLKQALTGMGVMYACGAAATYGYGQLMVHTAQRVIGEIRADLFAHVQTLPLSYFDAHTHGELMSRFTNDVDTL